MATQFKTLDEYVDEQLESPDFQTAWQTLEPAYQIARLRIRRGLTQGELAARVGTQQPSIARLESGILAPPHYQKSEPPVLYYQRQDQASLRLVFAPGKVVLLIRAVEVARFVQIGKYRGRRNPDSSHGWIRLSIGVANDHFLPSSIEEEEECRINLKKS